MNPHSNIRESPMNPHSNIRESLMNPHSNIRESLMNPHSNIPQSPINPHSNNHQSPINPHSNNHQSPINPHSNNHQSSINPQSAILNPQLRDSLESGRVSSTKRGTTHSNTRPVRPGSRNLARLRDHFLEPRRQNVVSNVPCRAILPGRGPDARDISKQHATATLIAAIAPKPRPLC